MAKVLSTQLIDGPRARLILDGAEIRVTAGPDKGTRVILSADPLLIGSLPSCELVLHDKTVSGRHAEVRSTARGYVIRDLGSTNGIVYGTQPIGSASLSHGLRLHLGETTLLVHALGRQFEVPLACAGEMAGLIAHSVKMRAFVAALERVALSDATVLIEGETGVGKELAASALHRLSPRNGGPLVTFDCAAVPKALAAAELFGHEKGAFTGAGGARSGLISEAEGGTLFIDEVGELPLDLQPLLLGAIDRKRSRRLGGTGELTHDVRIVAATNRNLAEQVRSGRFRQDLYYRLAVARLRVPPLRERPEDIPYLADRFGCEVGVQISPESLAPFASYDWPGNVRELKNTVTRMIVQSANAGLGNPGSHQSVPEPKRAAPLFDEEGHLRPWPEVVRLAKSELEYAYLKELYSQAGGKLMRAAELSGITYQSLGVLLERHGIRRRGT